MAPAIRDPALIESLIAHMVGKAVQHNVDGGRVDISTAIAAGRAAA